MQLVLHLGTGGEAFAVKSPFFWNFREFPRFIVTFWVFWRLHIVVLSHLGNIHKLFNNQGLRESKAICYLGDKIDKNSQTPGMQRLGPHYRFSRVSVAETHLTQICFKFFSDNVLSNIMDIRQYNYTLGHHSFQAVPNDTGKELDTVPDYVVWHDQKRMAKSAHQFN